MTTNAIPQGLRTITPQLSLDGASDAIEFYRRAFGAEEIHRAADPSGTKIWHAQIQIGDSMLFVNDVFPGGGPGAQPTTLWLYSHDVDAAFQRAVDAGAKVAMPLADMFWGDRVGQVTDAWGNRWCLTQHTRDVSPEEMKKATEAFGKK